RTSQNSSMQLFWASSAGYAAERSLTVPVQGGNEWRTVDVDLSAVPTWQGIMVGFRIDPPAVGIELDEVRFLPGIPDP
ncbi:MAG: hypothetical protein GXY83_42450, partial [Rhodopirellula sp.]|nr:hypothetical protein [Rhodopirellula sp.]